MKPRVCILLNNFDDDLTEIIELYLPKEKFCITLTSEFPEDFSSYHIIAPLNYRSLIKDAEIAGNVVVFHASDLPDGKGWAPIYYALYEGNKQYVVTGIKASNKIDEGEVLIRAKFDIKANYTASFLRDVDNHLFFLLISKLLTLWPDGKFLSLPQQGLGSYKNRRSPADNEVNINSQLVDLIPHLRAVEDAHPAYFFYEGTKYLVSIKPEEEPKFPSKVYIQYEYSQKTEMWEGWA